MRTPIRLPGRTRHASRLLAAALAVSVISPLGGFAAAVAPARATNATHAAAHVAVRAAAPAPVRSATTLRHPADVLPASSACVGNTCDIYATVVASYAVPGTTASVTIWGYSASATPGSAGLPGPTLIVTAGSDLTVNLHNLDVPSATSLSISQLAGIPDTVGVTAGGSKTYTIAAAALQPGTYLYEAGLTADGPRQVAMGLFGALVVRPASCANCAYDTNSTFDDEALIVLSEIDPAFNANPFGFNLSYFAPKYWLIDGKAYPGTDPVATTAGDRVLLRYVNAGLAHHSMSLLGLHERVVGADGKALVNQLTLVDDTIPSGSAVDAIATVPGSATPGTQYALFEAAMHLDNNGILTSPPASNPSLTPIAFGGMLTFLAVGGSSGGGTGGPVTSAVSLTPNPTNGSVPVTLHATITSASSTVSAAEYFVDSVGADGAGCPLAGTFGSASVNDAAATIPVSGAAAPCVDLSTLASGTHTFYVHGEDAASTWGAVASAHLNLDKTGPSVSGTSLTPSRTNGAVDVKLQATASDAATGGQNVIAAEYFIDPAGTPALGSGTAITMPTPAADVSLSVTLAAATVAALSQGTHTIAVRAQDAAGNWGSLSTVTLTLDKTGPATSGVTATPNPTNGLFGVQIGSTGQLYERIDATIADPVSGGVNSTLVGAEYFIDTLGANGTGGPMLATDGVFNSSSEGAVGAAELFAIAALSQGSHTIYVHGKDAAGNWGPTATTTLVVDRTRPFITSAAVTPNPTAGATTVTLNVAVIDRVNINRIEYFIGADPGQGNGIAITSTTPVLPAPNVTGTATVSILNVPLGTATISIRARNASNNWSSITTVSFTVSALFANGFDSGNFTGWSTRGGNLARTTVTAGAAQAGGFGMAAQILSGTSGFVQDNTPLAETRYRARFYMNPNSVTLTNLTPYTVFTALNNLNSNRFTVLLRRNGVQYQVSTVLTRNGGTTASNWFNVSGTAFTAIEVAWSRTGNNLSLSLYTGGVLAQTVTGVSTNGTQAQYRIDSVRMGPQGTLTGATGTIFFDSFVSTRTTPVIGL